MKVPTFDGFVAMKASAWIDRRAARDLVDLDALSRLGAVSEEARQLVAAMYGYPLTGAMIDRRVLGDWRVELAHQTRLDRSEEECLARVIAWWDA